MGELYRARDARLGRDVAIKVVPPSVADNPEALARFERESHAIAALSHPNVLTIFDVGHSDGHCRGLWSEWTSPAAGGSLR